MINLIASCGISLPKDKSKINNEDAILTVKELKDGYILAVADGVGSYKGAEKASRAVIDYLKSEHDLLSLSVANILNRARERVLSVNSDPEFSKAATTLSFAYLNQNELRIGHVGDCRIYIKDNNKLRQLTKDHTQHQRLLDEKFFTKKELSKMGGKNILMTAISKYIDMIYQEERFALEDLPHENGKITLYIMSDGAHSFWHKTPRLSEKTMSSVIKFTNSLLRRIERLEPTDDYSIVCAEFEVERLKEKPSL